MVVSWTILKTPAAGCLKWRQNAGHIEQHPNTNPVLYWPPEVTRRSYRTLTARDCQLCSPGLSVVFSKICLDRTNLFNDPYKHLVTCRNPWKWALQVVQSTGWWDVSQSRYWTPCLKYKWRGASPEGSHVSLRHSKKLNEYLVSTNSANKLNLG